MAVASPAAQASSTNADIDAALAALQAGSQRLARLPLADRLHLAEQCISHVDDVAHEWVELACRAKQIPDESSARSEEITAGPIAVLRFLQLAKAALRDVERHGQPRLPGRVRTVNGQLRVPVFPTRELFDALLFRPITAETWLAPEVTEGGMFGDRVERVLGQIGKPQVALVLGAGNVSSIPATDALSKILHESQAVLLKMNPVNDYLGDLFCRAFRPLVDAGFLQMVHGGAEVGATAIADDRTQAIHITGSIRTHDAIVWGASQGADSPRKTPSIDKPITSELGNVSPWIVVPDRYTSRAATYQAQNIAASIANNASFNCIATKMVVTWKQWPDRERWLDQIDAALAVIPERYAYYPGAFERFRRFAGRDVRSQDQQLPWTLIRNVDPRESPHFFREESFVCVCGETALDADSPEEFLERAVEFVNQQMWGTLSAAITVTDAFRRAHPHAIDAAIGKLRYGTVGINQWPALSFALMSPPWGGYPHGVHLSDAQSGIGSVHNTYLLDSPEKTVVSSPVTTFPKPVWFASHRRAVQVAWKLCDLYARPSIGKLPSLFWDALRG